jgi:hypothetical protein
VEKQKERWSGEKWRREEAEGMEEGKLGEVEAVE